MLTAYHSYSDYSATPSIRGHRHRAGVKIGHRLCRAGAKEEAAFGSRALHFLYAYHDLYRSLSRKKL